MSEKVIQAEGIGKQYRIGLREKAGETFREALVNAACAPFRRFRTLKGLSDGGDLFWALQDVSFDVEPGEVVGIIGRNGAGKSTLLKVLSRITEPTAGRAWIRGRVGSLLEVGTGFHPELTGRENVYLNGAILGMKKADIDRRFDEIVAFAEIDRFLDTPIKRFSSGMCVRLGFAVAAHMEPDILLVDEVLAVGDLGFQKKCLGKMEGVAGSGRTVLFVSHNMAAVQQLCSRAILIDNGRVVMNDKTAGCIEAYRDLFRGAHDTDLASRSDRSGSGAMKFVKAEVVDQQTNNRDVLTAGNDAVFRFTIRPYTPLPPKAQIILRLAIIDARTYTIAFCSNHISGDEIRPTDREFTVECGIKRLPLNRGRYSFAAAIGTVDDVFDYLEDLGRFEVTPGPFYPTNRLPEADHSATLLDYCWNQSPVEALVS